MLLAASLATADGVVLFDGRHVDGTILTEDSDIVQLRTASGDIHFQKIELRAIVRGGSAADALKQLGITPRRSSGGSPGLPPPSAAANTAPLRDPSAPARAASPVGSNPFDTGGGDPFGSAPAAAGDPFGAAPAADTSPFGAAPAAGGDPFGGGGSNPFGAAPTANTNPFGSAPAAGGDPFGGGGGSNPFGAAPAASAPAANANPFGGTAGGANPFGAGSDDPWAPASGAAAAAPAPAPKANPFGGGGGANPFGAGGDDPWAPAPGAAAAPAAVPEAAAEPRMVASLPATASAPAPVVAAAARPGVPKFRKVERATPEVKKGFDGIVYSTTAPWSVEIGQGEATLAQWQVVEEDTDLRVGNHVRTNDSPEARLRLRAKQDELRLPRQSHIELRELSEDSEEVTIFLHSGSIWSDVSRRANPDSFVVETPELTAGVRGTNFRVDRLTGGAQVAVFSGEVQVQARKTGVFVTLKPNQSAVINADGQILDMIATPVDEGAIWNTWEQWAIDTAAGSGSMVGGSPIANLTQQIAADNARWETDMREYQRNTAMLKYMDKVDEYAHAFLRFAEDTGVVPTDEQGWSLLRFDTGIAGWNGPYVEGPIPPKDPWHRPLRYILTKGATGRLYGMVYSLGQDGVDRGGRAQQMAAHVMYFQLERFKDDPEVNPQ